MFIPVTIIPYLLGEVNIRRAPMELEPLYLSQMIKQFEPLINKTLHKFKLYSTHIDYEDYAQELRIKLLEIGKSFDGKPLVKKDDRYRFIAYADNGLAWHLVNLLKKNKPVTAVSPEILEETLEDFLITPHYQVDAQLAEYASYAKQALDSQEYLLYLMLMDQSFTGEEMANLLGISRSTLYEWKKSIQIKLNPLYDATR